MKYWFLTFLFFTVSSINAQQVSGFILDDEKLPLIGANVHLVELNKYTTTGMDGSFVFKDVPAGTHTLEVSFIGFLTHSQSLTIEAGKSHNHLNINLHFDSKILSEFEVIGEIDGSSIAGSRMKEKESATVMNVTSAEAIELSPDNSVSEVIQRVSGVTLESNNNGTGESFAIIRGMPKRYNYTLVNSIKIPSSDNKNRYVSLDLFPSDLLERLEVVKSLTPDMEGDAVGGVVNMVMRKAPKKRILLVNAFTGYHAIFLDKPFKYFDASSIATNSPFEINGPTYKATSSDFTTDNLETHQRNFTPDTYASLTYGRRFLKNKVGLLLSGTANKVYSGTESVRFEPSTTRDGSSLPVLTNMKERFYYNDISQFGLNAMVDYRFSKKHSISLSGLLLDLNNNQLRDQVKTRLWGVTPGQSQVKVYSQRFRKTHRRIYNFTLQGEHRIASNWKLDWKVAYSKAKKERPDHSDFVTVSNYSIVQGEESILVAEDGDNRRSWEYNTDKDITGILNISREFEKGNTEFKIKFGGLYRIKSRNSFIVTYNFNPDPGVQAYGNGWVPDDQDLVNYSTWEKYGDINFRVRNPQGSTRNELNNDSHQNITAGYGQFEMNFSKLLDVVTGVRIEYTDQGYLLLAPRAGQTPESNQTYSDILPSLALKYRLSTESNVRFSYFYSIIRPGYFELVPYIYRQEDYLEMGNPELKKIRTHNIDLRYEKFNNATGQFLLGIFYKQINDPIEYVLTDGKEFGVNDIVRRPDNFGTATNLGVEINYIKYIHSWGVKFNYSYTHSSITTDKSLRKRENPEDDSSPIITVPIEQTRPLQGQAANIGNISLLYKGSNNGLNAQLAFTYTGEKIRTVSNFYNNDEWIKPFYQLDFSIEKKIKTKWAVYLKLRNLLNAKYQTFIKQPVSADNSDFPYQGETGDNVLTGQELIGRSVRMGVRFKL